MNDYFSEIRERVSAEDSARFYGMEFSRDGKRARCCFHSPDKNPSMTFRGGNFRCWSCGAHGSSLDLTMRLLGLDLKGAAGRLNADFDLGLDREPTAVERDAARRVTDARKLFSAWKDRTLNELDAAIRVANTADLADTTDAEALAIRHREHLEHIADILQHGPLSEQMEVFRQRKEIESLCKMIMSNSPTRSQTA